MTEDEKIKLLTKPILDKLIEIEEKYGDNGLVEVPQVRFIREDANAPIVMEGIEITDELLEKLEAYIQDEIEMMHAPTILH